MRERDRQSLRAHREEIEAIERAEREARERPIRQAEEVMNKTVNELAKVYRERLLAKVKDPDVYIDPEVSAVSMTREQANKFNAASYQTYRSANPEIYWGAKNELAEAVADYWTKNKVEIATASMFAHVVDRMREVGMLPDPPPPEPEPEPEQEPIDAPKPEVFEGWDLESGEPRTYTRREVDRMGGDEYRRVFRIYKAALEESLPRFGPGSFRRL